jgi:tetratricopeptide (TPR) repeat protein
MLARGKMEQAEPALRHALDADRREGRISDEIREGSALVWALAVQQQRFAAARAVLESLKTGRDVDPEAAIHYSMSEGLLAAETNDLRNALASYRMALHSAERLARNGLENSAAEDLARILVMMGRSEEAVPILQRLPPKEDPFLFRCSGPRPPSPTALMCACTIAFLSAATFAIRYP